MELSSKEEKVDEHGALLGSALAARQPEVVAFMARQPRAVKYTEWNSKILLRALAQRYLPQAILNRPKQGFAIPLGA